MKDISRHQTLPLTTAQRGLWMTQFLAPSGSSFNIAEAIHLYGTLRIQAFLDALKQTRKEAETLRTEILPTSTGPCYRITTREDVHCPIIDLRDVHEPEAAAMSWMHAQRQKPLDLEKDALWQNALLQISETHWIWFHCCHHAVLDGFSGGLVAARVATLYSAFCQGTETPDPVFLPLVTLHDQEEAYRQSDRYQLDKAYWLEQVRDAPDPVSLSLRSQRAPNGEHGGALTRSKRLEQPISDALKALGRAHGSSLPQTLTALLVAYLYRMTGQDDLVVGMPVSARANRLLRHTPGMVANAVALRFQIQPGSSFVDLIGMARRAMRGALRHQQYRYEDLRRDLGMFGMTQQITRIGINIEPFDYVLPFEGLTTRNVNLSNGAMEDLTIFVFDRQDGNGLSVQFDANPALYTEDELDAHLERVERFCDILISAPEAALSCFSLISETERLAQKARNESTAITWPTATLSELIMDGVGTGASPLIDDSHGSLSRENFRTALKQMADSLREAGIGAGHLVALALPRDRRMVLCIAAVIEAGAAWLPVDIDAPLPRARLIIEDACPSLVILPSAQDEEWACGRKTAWIDHESLSFHPLSDLEPHNTAPGSVPPDTAYVTYTSGTTGRPKGVIIPRSALINFLYAIRQRLDFGPDEVLLAVTTWTFDIAILEILLPLTSGARSVIAEARDIRDPKRLAALITTHNVTVMQATPTLWQTLLGSSVEDVLRGLLLLSGGEAMPAHMANQMVKIGRAAWNLYGPTETTIWSTACKLEPNEVDTPSAGLALANTRLSVVDRWGHSLPDGVIGELLIAGDGVATGYLNRPDLTVDRFIPEPAHTEKALAYRTGDRAAFDNSGKLNIFGRADQQIKIRGMRIEPNEIESTLLGLPEVLQAAVMIHATKTHPVLAAYLVPAIPGSTLDPAQIRRSLLSLLPPQMIPVKIVSLDNLPRLTSGKLDRVALQSLKENAGSRSITGPSTAAEHMLSKLWCELLSLDEVDIHTSFFDLGGDSIMAVQMISALAAEGYELPVGQVFASPTIALLAPLFEETGVTRDPLATLLPIRTTGDKAPIFCFHPVIGMSWSFHTLAPLLPEGHPVYGLQDAGLLLGNDAPETLDALIDLYVTKIRSVQATGPYYLVGWSMGGVIAHGIARLLRRQGEKIALLTLLDSYPALGDDSDVNLESPEALKSALDFLQITPDAEVGDPQSLDELADLVLSSVDTSVLPDLPKGDRADLFALAEKMRHVTRRNLSMLMAYRPKQTDVDILFVRAARKAGSGINDSPEAWQAYTTGQIDAHNLPCRHGDLLTAGHVEAVAQLINVHLSPSGEIATSSNQGNSALRVESGALS